MDSLEAIQIRLRKFAAQREWEGFHTPKNLSMALAGETGELLEIFQWLTEEESGNLSDQYLASVREELADIAIYLLRLADVLQIDLIGAVESKIALNERKYPVEESRGNATKYDRRQP
jgi:dCTP diphosphatase